MPTSLQKIARAVARTDRGNIKTPGKPASASFRAMLTSEMMSAPGFNRAVSPFLNNDTLVARKNPMKYGIVQSTLKDYDPEGRIARNVAELTKEGARRIYRMIWDRAGCDALPAGLAETHFRAYVQRPRSAIEALKLSGGDPGRYADAVAAQRRPSKTVREEQAGPHARAEHKTASAAHGIIAAAPPPAFAPVLLPPVNPPVGLASSSDRTAAEAGQNIAALHNGPAAVFIKTPQSPAEYADTGTPVIPQSEPQTKPLAPELLQFTVTPFNAVRNTPPAPEIGIPGTTMTIAIEQREPHGAIEAYHSAKSGSALANGFAVKIRIPF